MIRWRYLATRLIIVFAVLALLRLAMGPVAGIVTQRGLQTATGARVEIGAAEIGLFPPRVRYERFRVADPRDGKQMRDAFRADTMAFELDGQALLRRRWVAREGTITGLRIGAKRDTSGHFDLEREEREAPSLSDKPGVLSQLLGGLTDQWGRQAESAADQLETVRRSREIKQQWRQEYETISAQAKSLEKKVRQFKTDAGEIENPLRDWERIGDTVAMAEETRGELKSILARLETVPSRFDADLASLEQAKRRDLERLDQYVPGNLAESKNFGIDLVSQAVQQQVARIRDYWESGRTLANYTVVAPEQERGRGVVIDLLGDQRQPDILIRRCRVQGMMRADGNAYNVTGVVENLTPTPSLLVQPLHAQLQLDGPELVRLDYVRDRRGHNDIDRLTLHWPQSRASELTLGDDQHARVAVRGGNREVWVQMRSEADRVEGRFVSKQTGVQLSLQVDSKFAELPATVALRESLAAVDSVTIDAGFQGTWRQMSMDVNTNLGHLLRDAVEQAVAKQVDASKQQLARQVQQAYQDEQAELRRWFQQKQLDTQSLTAKADELLEDLGRELIDGVESSDVTIGRINDFLNGRLR